MESAEPGGLVFERCLSVVIFKYNKGYIFLKMFNFLIKIDNYIMGCLISQN